MQSKYTAFLLLATDFAHGRGTGTFPCSVEHPAVGSPPAQRVPNAVDVEIEDHLHSFPI